MITVLFAQAQDQDFDRKIKELELLSNTNIIEFESRALEMKIDAMEEENPEHLSRVLMVYGERYYRNAEYEAADSIFRIIQSLDQDQVSMRVANRSKLGQARVMGDLGDRKEAIKNVIQLVSEFRTEKDTLTWIDSYNSLASMYDEEYKRDSALTYFLEALDLAKAINAHFQQAYLLNNIGLFFIDSQQFDKAEEYFKRAKEQAGLAEAPYLEGLVINNLGLVFMSNGDHEIAKSQFQEFLRLSSSGKSDRTEGIACLNIGVIYYLQDKLDSSLIYHDLGLEHFKKIEQPALVIRANNGKARLLIKMGRYSDAMNIAFENKDLAKDQGLLEDEMLANKLVSNVLDSLGRKGEALSYYKTYKSLSDSLQELRRDKVVTDMQTKYDVKEKEAELVMKEAEIAVMEKEDQIRQQNDQIRQFRWTIIIISAAVLVIGLGIFFYVRVQRNNRKMQESFSQELIKSVENERGRIAQDLHDGVGQDLSVLKNKINTIKDEKSPQIVEIEKDLSVVIEQTRQISRSLYPSYLRKVGLTEALSSLLDRTEEATGIICTYDLPILKSEPDNQVKTHVFRIVQECISNTIKHSGASALKVDLRMGNEQWKMVYQDNGTGLGSKKAMHGMGMMSMGERVKMMGGNLSVTNNESGKGFRLTVTFDPGYA